MNWVKQLHLYLIRHAESENNARPEHERVDDPSITDRGVQQATSLAQWLATHPMDMLLTSPFRRALQTAAPVALRANTKIQVWCDIYERGGCYSGWEEGNVSGAAGLTQDGILQLLPTALFDEPIAAEGWWGGKPREQDQQTRQRASIVKQKVEQKFADSQARLAMITHAEFQRILLAELLINQDIDVFRLGPICNAGITYLNFRNGVWQLQWFNAVTHIPSELITGAKG